MPEVTRRFQVDADASNGDVVPAPSSSDGPGPDEQLDELRALLVGPERQRLESLQYRLDDADARTADVADVLPDAIARREKPDRRLAAALGPTLEDAFRASVRKNPKELADAISPVLAPAIRKAIRDALQRMVQSLQTVVNHSLSPQSFRWRFEAWRTGVPFGQVVLAHTLVYQVEQVFLIHRDTGLQLLHVVAPHAAAQDPGMVAGMLTAIRDFAHDAFPRAGDQAGVEAGDESLYRLQIGGLSVWVEPGARAHLAAVIRGVASEPQQLQETLRDALDAVHLGHAADLDGFDGDAAPFERSRPLLEQCLVQVTRWDRGEGGASAKPARRARAVKAGAAVAAALLLGSVVVRVFLAAGADRRERRRWADFVARVRAEPGVVVTEARRDGGGRYVLSGLRDPLGRDPRALAAAAGFAPANVTGAWAPYRSLDPAFVRARAESAARAALAPPDTVRLTVDGAGTLRAEGEAPGRWAADARRLARALPGVLPGVLAYDDARLANADLPRLGARRTPIEAASVRFVEGSVALKGMQDAALDDLADRIAALAADAAEAGTRLRVAVVASDAASDDALARRRAESIRRALIARGVSPPTLRAETAATAAPTGAAPATRPGGADVVRFRASFEN